MPQVQKIQDRNEKLRQIPVQDIEDVYRQGYITAADKNKLLHEKARATTEQLLEEKGYLGAIFAQTVQHLQDGWNNLKESAIREPSGKVTTEMYYVGLAIWGEVQILTSALNAVGEVTGQAAETMALKAGASPGLARVINIATDVATGFVPVGLAAKSAVKGVQAIQKAGKAKAAAKGAQEAEQLAAKVIGQGLEAEGVKGAEIALGEVGQGAAKAAKEGTELAEHKVIREAVQAIPELATPSVAEQFAADLAKFQKEMVAVTATQSHEVTARLASKLGLSLDDLKNVVPGQALDERQMWAYLKALEPQADKLIELSQAVVREGTEEAANALARHASEFFSVAPIFRGAEVTAGRSVEILKEVPPMKRITDMLMAWDPESMAKGDFKNAMLTFAEDIVGMAEQKEKVTALAVVGQSAWQRFKDKGWPMIREGYINLLLARPVTQVRNFLGNSIAAANSVMERTAGGIFSADKKAGLVGQEGWFQAKGMALALGDGFKAFGQAFKKLDADDVSRLDFVPGEIPGVLGRIIRTPGDTMRGMDNFFKTILRRGSHYATAIRDGVHRGMQGDDLADFVARRVNHPTEKMLKEAEEFAPTNTFQNELGTIGKKVRDLAQTGPLALYFPFMKTPMNLAKYAWNRTPGIQLLSKSLYDDIAAGGVKADMAIGRLTMSNMMGMFLFDLAKDGIITGSGPVDPALRRVWLTTHEPYSVKTKEGWIPITNTEPGTTVLGLMGDYAQIVNQLDEPSAGQGAMAVVFSIMHNLADKTYWQTVGDLVEIASGLSRGQAPSQREIGQVVAGPLMAVATGGPLMASVTRAVNPIRREARTFMDGLMVRIPGYSKDVPALRDPYGDPILPPQAVGGPWLGIVSPLTARAHETDRVKLEGEKLQIRAPKFPGTIGGPTRDDFDIRAPLAEDKIGVELSPQQRDRWQVINRNLLRHPEHGIEKQLLDRPEYQEATRAMKRELFMDFMAETRTTAREALTIEDMALGKKMLENEATALLPILNAQDRAAAEAQIQESITLWETLAPGQRQNLLRWGILESEEEP